MTMRMTHETPPRQALGNTPLGRRSQSTGSTDSESESAGDEAPGGGTRLLLGCGTGRARFRLPPEPPEVERLALLAVRVPLVPALFCSRRACAAAALAQGGGVSVAWGISRVALYRARRRQRLGKCSGWV